MKSEIGIMIFTAGKDMDPRTVFYSADGDFVIVLQHGVLDMQAELGHLLVRPNEIAVMPRGIRYRVSLPEGPVRGYILELYQHHFDLPELGPIGSNCLAIARGFQAPVAAFDEDIGIEWHILCKFNSCLFKAKQLHTPLDVVAWHGLCYPYSTTSADSMLSEAPALIIPTPAYIPCLQPNLIVMAPPWPILSSFAPVGL